MHQTIRLKGNYPLLSEDSSRFLLLVNLSDMHSVLTRHLPGKRPRFCACPYVCGRVQAGWDHAERHPAGERAGSGKTGRAGIGEGLAQCIGINQCSFCSTCLLLA